MVHCGGAGNKVVQVLLGTADAYVYPQNGTKRWDTAAPEALAKAAGAFFTDAYGDEILYDADADYANRDGILCTVKYHESYLIPADKGPRPARASKM